MSRATELCLAHASVAGLLRRLPRGTGQPGVFLIEEAGDPERILLPVPSKVWDKVVPLLQGHPVFSVNSQTVGGGERR